MTNGWFDQLVAWIGAHPLAAGLVIFAIAFCDAVIVVGAIVPALPLLFAIGELIGLGELYGPYAVACAALGAFIGDGLSFWIGRRWGSQLRGVWPFARYPQLLDRSEAVFRRNALKGIVIARYIGPIRPFVPAVGQQAIAVAVALGQADLVEQRVGFRGVEGGISLAVRRLVERAVGQHQVVRRQAEAVVDDLVDLGAVDAERKRLAETGVAVQRAPYRVRHVEVRIERELRAAHRLPQPHVIAAALLRRLQEGVVGEVQSTRLQVGLAGRRLGRHQGAADDVEDEALGIGELLPGSVDAVVVRIARGDEAGGRLRRGVAPGLHRRQVGIDRVVGVADAVVELRPATRAGGRDGCLDLRSEEHTSELPSLMRISYAVFCLQKTKYM